MESAALGRLAQLGQATPLAYMWVKVESFDGVRLADPPAALASGAGNGEEASSRRGEARGRCP